MNPQTGLPMTNLEWCFARAEMDLGDYDDCITTTRERRTWLGDAPQLIAIYLLFPPAVIAFSHLMSYAFLDPFVCVGATPVYVIGLLILPDVFIIFLGLAFGGWMPGSKEAQLFNWNALEAMAAFAWLGSFVSPPNVIVFTLLRVMRMAFVATKGNSPEAWNPTWPSYWVLCVILITQFVVFEGLAYVKDRLYTRPLPYTKTRFSTRSCAGTTSGPSGSSASRAFRSASPNGAICGRRSTTVRESDTWYSARRGTPRAATVSPELAAPLSTPCRGASAAQSTSRAASATSSSSSKLPNRRGARRLSRRLPSVRMAARMRSRPSGVSCLSALIIES